MINGIRTYLEICRPLNSVFTMLVVVVGGLLAQPAVRPSRTLLLAALAAGLVAAGGNVINDVYDYWIDQVNKPKRPLPSGRITVGSAITLGVILSLVGISLGFYVQVLTGLIAIFVALLLWVYNAGWKHLVLIGNLTVALCGALAFVYGALTVGNIRGGLIPGLFAFLIHTGREIVKDTEDVRGDRKSGSRTLPIVVGTKVAQRFAAGLLLVLVIVTLLPAVVSCYGGHYLILIILLADLPLVVMAGFLFYGTKNTGLKRISTALKLVMLGGLVALFLSKLEILYC